MGRVKYAVYQTPGGETQEQKAYARVITCGKKTTEDICSSISEASSFTSSDVKGVLEALSRFIGRNLSYGYGVEVEGLGHFLPSLKTKERVNEKGKIRMDVSIDGVTFRCSPRLKRVVKSGSRPQKVKRSNVSELTYEERKAKLVAYLKKNMLINLTTYQALIGCTYYKAKQDFVQYEQEVLVIREGCGTHRVYRLA